MHARMYMAYNTIYLQEYINWQKEYATYVYDIAGKFGGELNLAVWRYGDPVPNRQI